MNHTGHHTPHRDLVILGKLNVWVLGILRLQHGTPSDGLSVMLAKIMSKSIKTMPIVIISLLKDICFCELTGWRKLGYSSEVLNIKLIGRICHRLSPSHKLQWRKAENRMSRNTVDSGLLLKPFAGFAGRFLTKSCNYWDTSPVGNPRYR